MNRIKQISADDLLAYSRAFDLPIGFFFTPPKPSEDVGLAAPDAKMKGLDPIVLLDAVLGRPDNLEHWERELDEYASSVAPEPKSKREKPHVSPSDLPDRLQPLGTGRARALLRQAFGDVTAAGDVLERVLEAIRVLDDTAQDDTRQPAPAGAARKAARR
ncbi:MAG: hypothetical protein ACRD0G_08750 [Acidimicrobiales bacterium]